MTAFLPQSGRSSELETYSFPSIYGGRIDTKQWQGKPYLVVNTASQCAFTKQYADLQKLYDTYRDAGFGIIAIHRMTLTRNLIATRRSKAFVP